MLEVGRVCVKTAGRDAGRTCVIVDMEEGKYEIDGQTRRRWVNAAHLEPLMQKVELKKGASHTDVVKALKTLDVEARERKPKKASPRPRKQRKVKAKKEALKKKASKSSEKAAEKLETKPKPVKTKEEKTKTKSKKSEK